MFVASASGRVYALDATHRLHLLVFDAQSGVPTAISIAEFGATRVLAPKKAARSKKSRHHQSDTNAHLEVQKPPSAALFGDDKGAVYAIDAEKGTLLWKTQVDAHPLARIQGAPTLYLDRLYVAVGSSEAKAALDPGYPCCTFRGSLAAIDIASGRIVWKTYLVADEPLPAAAGTTGAQQFGPAGAGIDAAPTIDSRRSLVYVTTGNSYHPSAQPTADAVVAVDLLDGKVRWAKQLPRRGRRAAPASRPRRSCAVSQAASRSSSPDSSPASSTRSIQIAPARSSGKPRRADAAGAVDWGPAADHHSLYVALSGPGASGRRASPPSISRAARNAGRATAPTPACSWGAAPLARMRRRRPSP